MDNKVKLIDPTRIMALVDGIYAFAMTLLVITIEPPKVPILELPAAIYADSDKFLSYLISFVVLGSFWVVHQKLFSMIKGVTDGYVWLNIFTMMFIVLIPYATEITGDYSNSVFGNVVFNIIMLLAGVFNYILWRNAFKNKLLKEEFEGAKFNLGRAMVMPIASIAGIGLSFIIPSWSPIVYMFVPISFRLFIK